MMLGASDLTFATIMTSIMASYLPLIVLFVMLTSIIENARKNVPIKSKNNLIAQAGLLLVLGIPAAFATTILDLLGNIDTGATPNIEVYSLAVGFFWVLMAIAFYKLAAPLVNQAVSST
jgi:hypothetical protein